MVSAAPAVNVPVQHVVLDHVSWETYESLLADYVDSSVPHFTYDHGKLEIVSPPSQHERDNQSLGLLVELVAAEWDMDVLNVGSTTFKRKDLKRGFEPDMSFYVQHGPIVRDKERIQLSEDPPPDLVIEIEVTNASIAKLPIYAEVGVPEVWRVAGDRVTILGLEAGDYREIHVSRAVPPMDSEVATRFLRGSRAWRRVEWIHSVRDWAREHAPAKDR